MPPPAAASTTPARPWTRPWTPSSRRRRRPPTRSRRRPRRPSTRSRRLPTAARRTTAPAAAKPSPPPARRRTSSSEQGVGGAAHPAAPPHPLASKEPAMNHCPDCGVTLAAGAAECFRCHARFGERPSAEEVRREACLLYTSDAADEEDSVDL